LLVLSISKDLFFDVRRIESRTALQVFVYAQLAVLCFPKCLGDDYLLFVICLKSKMDTNYCPNALSRYKRHLIEITFISLVICFNLFEPDLAFNRFVLLLFTIHAKSCISSKFFNLFFIYESLIQSSARYVLILVVDVEAD